MVITRPMKRASHILFHQSRCLSTLPNNPHIYVFPDERTLSSSLLTLLPTSPTSPTLAIGSSPHSTPNPSTFQANPKFLTILHSVLAQYCTRDSTVISSASAFASSAGSSLGSGGRLFGNQPPSAASKRQRRAQQRAGNTHDADYGDTYKTSTGAGGASSQGGAGGGERGGYVHVYDLRRPPDFGRIPEPEDIFGSVEVDADGNFVDGEGDKEAGQEGKSKWPGRYQESGTYRVVTKEGILGLSPFLREKLVERLKEEEARLKA